MFLEELIWDINIELGKLGEKRNNELIDKIDKNEKKLNFINYINMKVKPFLKLMIYFMFILFTKKNVRNVDIQLII